MSEKEHDWKKVEMALASAKWDFRSIGGIAAELGLPPGYVKGLLERNADKVRTTLSRDRRVLYALRSKPVTVREVIDSVLTLASR
jgi:hypothetical protein